jgi:PAS domain S-box-containing protein
MDSNRLIYLVPYFISLIISAGIFAYAWRHHRAFEGTQAYLWYLGGQTLGIFGFILEMISPHIESKILWDAFQWIIDLIILVIFPVFVIEFTRTKIGKKRLVLSLSLIVPVLFLVLLLTDSLHHLIYSNPQLLPKSPFPELRYSFTWLFYSIDFYAWLVLFTGIGYLFRHAARSRSLVRSQTIIIALGILVPVVGTILSAFGVQIAPQRDASPFTAAVGNMIIAWGLFRYRLFDIMPIARDIIVENMDDLVVVLDGQDRIVDINQAALKALQLARKNILGMPGVRVFAGWPALIEKYYIPKNAKTNLTIPNKETIHHFEISSTLLHDNQGSYIGRVFVAREITEYVALTDKLKVLNEELEKQVQERTKDLQKVAEQYRAVVENQTEFIVRWRPDRTRTFVNEAYYRYFGLTKEQALQVDFLTLIVEEDRNMVAGKISRLLSGMTKVETEIHRVIKPDGSIAWQEWTDQAIRDEKGNVIEFQSVGRDITDRIQAEDNLRKLSRAVEQSNASIVITDAAGSIEYVNPYFTELTGYAAEDVIGRNPRILQSGLTDQSVYDGLWKTITGGKEWKGEFCNKKKNGELYWESSSISPIIDFSGAITHFVAVKTDISEEKKGEDALRKSEAIYRQAIEVAGAVPYRQTYTGEGTSLLYDFIGDGIRSITGYGSEEFTEKLWDELILESHMIGVLAKYSFVEAIHKVRTGEVPIWQCEHRIRARDGSIHWVFEAAVELRDKDGISHGSIGLFQDITERKLADEALENANIELSQAYYATLEGWANALDLREHETAGHSRRVVELTVRLAEQLGLTGEQLTHIRYGAFLHDIGKIGIPDHILLKPSPLNAEEWKIMRKHPGYAYDLLKKITFLNQSTDIPYHHHEHWDGTGYPDGLKGAEIPLTARIFAVVDVWDALQSRRPYREAWPKEKIKEYIREQSGKYFDPLVVETFLKLLALNK